MSSYDILVIVLSVTLFIFLALSIYTITRVLKVIRKIEALTASAQETAVNVRAFTSKMTSIASLSTIGNGALKIVDLFKKERKNGKKR